MDFLTLKGTSDSCRGSISFCRTFHPVGQGAFYSEQIIENGSDKSAQLFSMVYDCGSKSSGMKNKISEMIDSSSLKDGIDILFISHFDSDHINCTKSLKPKYVVIPFLTEEQLKVLEIINMIQPAYLSKYDVGYYRDIHVNFPEAKIIYVHSAGEGGNNLRESLDIGFNNMPLISSSSVDLQSGAPIKFDLSGSGQQVLMEYVVYQPGFQKFVDEFKEHINNSELDWNDLMADPGKIVSDKTKMELLNEIYDKMKPKNEHSLLVYSYPSVKEQKSIYSNDVYLTMFGGSASRELSEITVDAPGCVYWGDATMGDGLPDDFYDQLLSKKMKPIGTLQVPHHGSYSSSGDKIYSNKNKFLKSFGSLFQTPPVCIISAGIQNQYGHPNAQIVLGLEKNGCPVHIVTEQTTSRLSGRWDF